MGLLGRKSTDAERAEELFSPYLDGQVTQEEGLFLERYLAEHAEAREKFDLLKSAVSMTRSLPAVKAPRSFVLPRSMARKPSLALRLYLVMRVATAAAVALFAFALAGDFLRQSAPVEQTSSAAVLLGAQTTETLGLAAPEALQIEPAQGEEPPAEAPAVAPTATALATLSAAGESSLSTETEAIAAESEPTAEAVEERSATAADAISITEAPEPQPSEAQTGERQADQDTSNSATEGPTIDVVRLALIGFGLLVVVLGATTLLLRRQL